MEEKCTALPATTDTEADTSSDFEKLLKDILKKPQNTTNRRRSLFNLTIEQAKTPEQGRKSEEFRSAEARANNEITEWRNLFVQAKKNWKAAEQKLPRIDISILPEDEKAYLLAEPDMVRYLRNLHEFHCNALRFMENEFLDMMILRENCRDLCKHKIQVAQQIKINKLHNSDHII